MPDWTRTVARGTLLTRLPWLRYLAIVLAACLVIVAQRAVPMFSIHPIALIYVFGLVAVWVGKDYEGIIAVGMSALYGYFLLPHFDALPVEVTIYLVNASVEWSLIYVLRHAYRLLNGLRVGPSR